MKRGAWLNRYTEMPKGRKRLRRTQMRRVGKRRKDEQPALDEFNRRDGTERCFVCDAPWTIQDYELEGLIKAKQQALIDAMRKIEFHHICPRSRGVGHPRLHDARNRMYLCSEHHEDAHAGRRPSLIKTRAWLDTLGDL